MDAVFLFLFLLSESWHAQKEEKLVFYQTTQIQKMDDSKEDTQFFRKKHRQVRCPNPVCMKQHKQQSRRLLFICAVKFVSLVSMYCEGRITSLSGSRRSRCVFTGTGVCPCKACKACNREHQHSYDRNRSRSRMRRTGSCNLRYAWHVQ